MLVHPGDDDGGVRAHLIGDLALHREPIEAAGAAPGRNSASKSASIASRPGEEPGRAGPPLRGARHGAGVRLVQTAAIRDRTPRCASAGWSRVHSPMSCGTRADSEATRIACSIIRAFARPRCSPLHPEQRRAAIALVVEARQADRSPA